ncbi:MAG: hypothetical protein ACRDHD_09735, partial [Candidatus Limnocylindria bacterium]
AELRRRGLEAPVSLLLAAHRPLRPLLAHVATFLAPTLRPVLGRQMGTLEAALADDEAYDRLLDALDERSSG